jgi:hypothetical protein
MIWDTKTRPRLLLNAWLNDIAVARKILDGVGGGLDADFSVPNIGRDET